METTTGLGTFLSGLAIQGLPMSEHNRYIANLEAVTPEQVAASVAAEIGPSQASIVASQDAISERRGDPLRRTRPVLADPARDGHRRHVRALRRRFSDLCGKSAQAADPVSSD